MNTYIVSKATRILIDAVNYWLKATGSPHRVTADGMAITRRDGVLFIALREVNHE